MISLASLISSCVHQYLDRDIFDLDVIMILVKSVVVHHCLSSEALIRGTVEQSLERQLPDFGKTEKANYARIENENSN